MIMSSKNHFSNILRLIYLRLVSEILVGLTVLKSFLFGSPSSKVTPLSGGGEHGATRTGGHGPEAWVGYSRRERESEQAKVCSETEAQRIPFLDGDERRTFDISGVAETIAIDFIYVVCP